MKKILLLALSLGVMNASFGQITIDSSNILHVNQTIYLNYASNTGLNNQDLIATSGANASWDFSGLDSVGTDALVFQEVSKGTDPASFPDASFVLVETDTDTISTYFLKSDVEFSSVGFAGVMEGESVTSHIKTQSLSFPSTYNTSFTNNDKDTSYMLLGQMRLVMSADQTSTIDGWGTATMPKGTFPVIRQKVSSTLIFSIQMGAGGAWQDVIPPDTTIDESYYWWTNDSKVKWSLVSLSYDTTNHELTDIAYVNTAPTPTGIRNIPAGDITVAPNPASHYLDFKLTDKGNYTLQVTDLSGRQVLHQSFKDNNYRLNISSLTPGLYLYNLTDVKTGQTAGGKFVKE